MNQLQLTIITLSFSNYLKINGLFLHDPKVNGYDEK